MLSLTFSLSVKSVDLSSPLLEMSMCEFIPIYFLERRSELLHGVWGVLAPTLGTAFVLALCSSSIKSGDLELSRT